MHHHIKQQWIAALKSGEYKQARRSLCVDNDGDRSFCCLGVLTDLCIKEARTTNPRIRWRNRTGAILLNKNELIFRGRVGGLHPDVIHWAGLDPDKHGSFVNLPRSSGYLCLALANDQGMSFDKIANLINLHIPTT